MHVKFEKSNSLMKNIVDIDSLDKDFKKASIKDSPAQDEEKKPKDDTNGESKILKWRQRNHFQRVGDMLQAILRTLSLVMYPKE